MSSVPDIDLDTSKIRSWRSIITLIVFVIANLIVLFPFHIPIYIPRVLWNVVLDTLSALRIAPPRQDGVGHDPDDDDQEGNTSRFVCRKFPVNFVTGPLIADLFLLAIGAIGGKEVKEGTYGVNNISPIDIMAFFITLAYIAISIDASGLIRYLAFKVLQWGGEVGHRLFFYLYAFFFLLGTFIGNDPIILSGTAFLAYMTRVSSNIVHPRAWIHTQFAVANICSAILVSSNPTNLVLAGAFKIKFIEYTANIIVPTVVTGIVLFPFLLYIVFANPTLIPVSIKMHELPEESRAKKPVNPNIPHARGTVDDDSSDLADDEQDKLLSLEEIMNPFLDKGGAAFGAVVMTATLTTLLAINAASTKSGQHYVYWVTLPGAFVMFCWDVAFGWVHRHETREIARKGREAIALARAERAVRAEDEARRTALEQEQHDATVSAADLTPTDSTEAKPRGTTEDEITATTDGRQSAATGEKPVAGADNPPLVTSSSGEVDEEKRVMDLQKRISRELALQHTRARPTLVSLMAGLYMWLQETFPTVTAVMAHLPIALIPFAFSMFVLVQGLTNKGWVPVFAYGWDHWVNKTGTIGAIGGMGFLSVILCNFAGTNIGTTILLSRVIQAWQKIHEHGSPISDRTFWATVYSMALGVNYGAFSAAFSASLAGLLWRDILAKKHIHVKGLEFARVNLPIIAISMTVGCAVLVGEVYLVRGTDPHRMNTEGTH